MSSMKANYLDKMIKSLEDYNYSKQKIEEIKSKIMRSRQDKSVEYTSWREYYNTLISTSIANLTSADIRYYSYNRLNAVVIRLTPTQYNVAFSFTHPSDIAPSNFDRITPDCKKYTLYNYLNNKYTYKCIEATSSINALVIAFNKHKDELVDVGIDSMDLVFKMYLSKKTPSNYYDYIPKRIDISPKQLYYSKDIRKEFRIYKDKLYKELAVLPQDVRYYTHLDNRLNAMVIKKDSNTYKVTFSFIKESDFFDIENSRYTHDCHIISHDRVKLSRTSLIKNYLDNRFVYEVTDCNNSMSSVVRAFNLYKNEFPDNKYYKYRKMRVDISLNYKYF